MIVATKLQSDRLASALLARGTRRVKLHGKRWTNLKQAGVAHGASSLRVISETEYTQAELWFSRRETPDTLGMATQYIWFLSALSLSLTHIIKKEKW